MNVTAQLVYLSVAFGWSALLITPFVIGRYMGMGRSVYELVSKGDVGLAATHIEDSKLIPALVELIEMVVTARDQKIVDGHDVSYAEILDEVEYRPAMARAQQAQTEVRDMEVAVSTLMESCKPIWIIGIFHVLTVVGAALDQIYVVDPWRFPGLMVLLTAAVLSLALDIALIIRFESKHNALLLQLSANRGR